MPSSNFKPRWRLRASGTLAAVLALTAPAHADERRELEQLRATTVGLIEALVQQGLIPRERADALLRQAQAPAVAASPTTPAAPAWGSPPIAAAAAGAATGGAAGAATAAAAGTVIRVPYLSETVRAQMREEIKNEVLSTAREERWADPRAMPSWLRGVTIEGDVRVRGQVENFDDPRYADGETDPCRITGGNLPAECWRTQTASPAWAPDILNTTNDRERITLRARLGIGARVGDDTSLGLRITTGTTNGPTSSSVTLGSGFNKSPIVLDRAFVRWEPRYDMRLIAGRLANPFFGSDLLWPDDLSFDGIAIQGEHNVATGTYLFGTAGAFPLEEFNVDQRDKWLYALQVGGESAIGDHTLLRLGVASYHFVNVQGVRENEPPPTGARAGTVPYFTSQYPSNVRLKGNTLINLNDPTSTAAPTWGLASRFRPINLTAALTMRHFDPMTVAMQLDWVHNGSFDLADIQQRAGASLDGLTEQTTGFQAKLTVGSLSPAESGEWQIFGGLRNFERDAWIDGFTDTTWHLGGTNYKGWTLGGSYAFDRRTTLGLRVTSTRNLDDGTVDAAGVPSASNNPLKIDVLQLDLNTRF